MCECGRSYPFTEVGRCAVPLTVQMQEYDDLVIAYNANNVIMFEFLHQLALRARLCCYCARITAYIIVIYTGQNSTAA